MSLDISTIGLRPIDAAKVELYSAAVQRAQNFRDSLPGFINKCDANGCKGCSPKYGSPSEYRKIFSAERGLDLESWQALQSYNHVFMTVVGHSPAFHTGDFDPTTVDFELFQGLDRAGLLGTPRPQTAFSLMQEMRTPSPGSSNGNSPVEFRPSPGSDPRSSNSNSPVEFRPSPGSDPRSSNSNSPVDLRESSESDGTKIRTPIPRETHVVKRRSARLAAKVQPVSSQIVEESIP